jgi:hypothetical protein
MQIFYSYPDLKKCAEFLDDSRLNKQCLESAQILSTVLWIKDCGLAETMYKQGQLYLPSHEHHPIVKWVAMSGGNFRFAVDFFHAVLVEFKNRFGKQHASSKFLDNFHPWLVSWDKTDLIPFPNCTTNHKHIDDVNEAYRLELQLKWENDKRFPKFTKGKK